MMTKGISSPIHVGDSKLLDSSMLSMKERESSPETQPQEPSLGKDYSKLDLGTVLKKCNASTASVETSNQMKKVSQSLEALLTLSVPSTADESGETEKIELDAQSIVDQVSNQYKLPQEKNKEAPTNKYALKRFDLNKASQILTIPSSPKKPSVVGRASSASLGNCVAPKSPRGSGSKYALQSMNFSKAAEVISLASDLETKPGNEEEIGEKNGKDNADSNCDTALSEFCLARGALTNSKPARVSRVQSAGSARSRSTSKPRGGSDGRRSPSPMPRASSSNHTSTSRGSSRPRNGGSKLGSRSASPAPPETSARHRRAPRSPRRSRIDSNDKRSSSPVRSLSPVGGARKDSLRASSYHERKAQRSPMHKRLSPAPSSTRRSTGADACAKAREALRTASLSSKPGGDPLSAVSCHERVQTVACDNDAGTGRRRILGKRTSEGKIHQSGAGTIAAAAVDSNETESENQEERRQSDASSARRCRLTSTTLRQSLQGSLFSTDEDDSSDDEDDSDEETCVEEKDVGRDPNQTLNTTSTHSHHTAVVVPFGQAVPKECIKKRQEALRRVGKMPICKKGKSFSDIAYDPEFADLYDDDDGV
ncbi:expressed unknown protein [Seminavis robusta]|uniref:Uncharacterized protein n=1 Tax=Seminavis robusta TaxID=568900 RepID=A0A9N8DGC0_9STRA|nr:expressed unknown protein [Seminavis robusta]|eukprot:Sro78_g042540.1 n/a (595) ;mRNA; r:89230-91014